MDLIEFVLMRLSAQAEAMGEVVEHPSETNRAIGQAAELLSEAASSRHDNPGPEGDAYEDQVVLIRQAESLLRERGVNSVLNPREAGPSSLGDLQTDDLLKLWADVMATMKSRGLVRSANRPVVGDYAEYLVAGALQATRPTGPDRGVDLVRADGITRVQVKARLDPPGKRATHFDVGRVEGEHFDELAAVVFAEDLTPRDAWLLGHRDLLRLADKQSSGKHRIRISRLDQAVTDGLATRIEL